jgi:hypothetical protein
MLLNSCLCNMILCWQIITKIVLKGRLRQTNIWTKNFIYFPIIKKPDKIISYGSFSITKTFAKTFEKVKFQERCIVDVIFEETVDTFAKVKALLCKSFLTNMKRCSGTSACTLAVPGRIFCYCGCIWLSNYI